MLITTGSAANPAATIAPAALAHCLRPRRSSIHRRMQLLLPLRRHCCYDVTASCIVRMTQRCIHTDVTCCFNNNNNVYYFWQPRAGLSPHAHADAYTKYIQTHQTLQMLSIAYGINKFLKRDSFSRQWFHVSLFQ